MLIQVLIVACLQSNPAYCEDFRIPLEPNDEIRYGVTPQLCTKFAVDLVAEWAKNNPGYVVKKWSCANYVTPKGAH